MCTAASIPASVELGVRLEQRASVQPYSTGEAQNLV